MIARREQQGHIPSIVPRQLLTHPIWFHPKTASCTPVVHRTWWDPVETSSGIMRVQRHTEQSNPLGEDPARSCSPHGLLRFLDLDVVMALSYAWIRQGDHIEIAQADLLRWMGYDDLLKAPYDELRASLERLTSTSIALWDGEQRAPGVMPFRIVEYASVEQGAHAGSRVIKATVSRYWIESLKSGRWQEVDLDAYAHLTRSYRRNGLARVIYCYLTANRDNSLESFRVLKDAVVQRYAPRKPDGKSLRYADHGNPNSALVRAMQVLRESGVIRPEAGPDTHLVGRFSTEGIPRIALAAFQSRICTDDIWGGGTNPQPTAAHTQGSAAEPTPPKMPQQGAPKPAARDPIRDSVIILNREIKCAKSALQRAVGAAWTPSALLHLMAEVLHGMDADRIQRPGAYLAKMLQEHAPTQYATPDPQVWEWLRTTGLPSLPVFQGTGGSVPPITEPQE
jgi:hypothetical protein